MSCKVLCCRPLWRNSVSKCVLWRQSWGDMQSIPHRCCWHPGGQKLWDNIVYQVATNRCHHCRANKSGRCMFYTKPIHLAYVARLEAWWLLVDDCGYRELNKVVPPMHTTVPSIHDLMDQLTTALGTYHYVVDLANAFFSNSYSCWVSRPVCIYLGRVSVDIPGPSPRISA